MTSRRVNRRPGLRTFESECMCSDRIDTPTTDSPCDGCIKICRTPGPRRQSLANGNVWFPLRSPHSCRIYQHQSSAWSIPRSEEKRRKYLNFSQFSEYLRAENRHVTVVTAVRLQSVYELLRVVLLAQNMLRVGAASRPEK